MLDMICNYCGKKYKDKKMDGSVCPVCGHGKNDSPRKKSPAI